MYRSMRLGAGSGKTVYRVHRLETSAWRKCNVFNGVKRISSTITSSRVQTEARPLSMIGHST